MRLVLDTNAVLALWLFRDPALKPLRDVCQAGEAVLLGNDACLEELARVLAYPEFGLDVGQAGELLDAYSRRLERVSATAGGAAPLPACKDRDDQKFLELARDGRADFLVTRDKALLKLARRKTLAGSFAILTPENILPRLAAVAPAA